MTLTHRRTLTGLLTGALTLTAFAQDEVDPRTGELVKPEAGEKKAPAPKADDPLAAPADVAAPPADADQSDSGLAWKILAQGTGTEKPSAHDGVVAHYSGWTTDGKLFDSSIRRGQPTPFPLDGVIEGWTEGLQQMVVGEKRRFWIPEELAYKGQAGQPAGMLVFDVELLKINKGPAPPENLTAPEGAEKTESGLATQILRKGDGKKKPGANDFVTIDLFLWDSKGKRQMAPSLQGQEPQRMPLGQMPVKGLVEGLQLMSKGEKRRLWVPKELSFQRGEQSESLVVDVELVNFEPDPNAPPEGILEAPQDAEKTESGIAWTVLKAADSEESPGATDTVTITFKGWNAKGQFLGSSEQQGRPLDVKVSQPQVKGWGEILPMMKKGEKRRLWIPAALGFARGQQTDDLIFEIEVLAIKKAIPAPADVAAAPEDAQKTESGLASKILQAGSGKENPTAQSKVTVHYTGWTTDGNMFDSSVQRGEPSSFALSGVIAGWTEGLQLMVVGEKRRFWIPEELAYKGRPGSPAGMLVFDVELIKIGD